MTATIATPGSRTTALSELASAARAVSRRGVTVGRVRGQPIPFGEISAIVTDHPSRSLRIPDRDAWARERRRFVADPRMALDGARAAW